jgi:hypothetical protein
VERAAWMSHRITPPVSGVEVGPASSRSGTAALMCRVDCEISLSDLGGVGLLREAAARAQPQERRPGPRSRAADAVPMGPPSVRSVIGVTCAAAATQAAEVGLAQPIAFETGHSAPLGGVGTRKGEPCSAGR